MEQMFSNIINSIQPMRVIPVLIGVMALDVLFGAFLSMKEGKFEPSLLASGLFKKLNVLVPLILAFLADYLLVSNYNYFTTFTGLFFIGYEGSSILETYARSGYKCPKFLTRIFASVSDAVEKEDDKELPVG